ncbi:MAG: 2,3-bisphosphoglycerate-independent phosphoglycerate mutase [Planctomyces sp.]|nr:2,3-bisphosphoglycerate-independent phosphoglycerate mutase [Planctomyces sp.]MBA4120316.1 2,3-bisphosphoglycerate-independent phosphoglycerate mutase [Isosphaera sp.]
MPAQITPAHAPLVLVVRDGWGANPNPDHAAFDAVRLARTPIDQRLASLYPSTLIKTSGVDVGVPPDQTGNSEVGHQNIGAGRIVDQEVLRVNKACASGDIAHAAAIRQGLERARDTGRTVHLMGIASEAGVHGRLSHLYALLRACKEHRATRVAVHLFTDGRDTPPTSGLGLIAQVEAQIAAVGLGTIATVAGRYYAMDRDFRWERVRLAYDALTGRGAPPLAPSAAQAVRAYYDAPSSPSQAGDEFVPPTVIAGSPSDARATRIAPGDTVIFYNYRGDRPRELAMALVLPDPLWAAVKPSPDSGARGFDRGPRPDTFFVAMTAWSEDLAPHLRVAFGKPEPMAGTAGQVISAAGLRQLRVAESEKYPHVTFFFNDYRERPFPGESRLNPQSPRVKTYDLQPEMAAHAVRDAVLGRLADPGCEPFILVNFANCDMVGHTGNLQATVAAVETTDACVGAIADATLARGGCLIVTADHGNAEQMWDPESGSPHTAHTPYDVPLYLVGAQFAGARLRGDSDPKGWFDPQTRQRRGRLADVMPTALAVLGVPQPPEMTGRSLLL